MPNKETILSKLEGVEGKHLVAAMLRDLLRPEYHKAYLSLKGNTFCIADRSTHTTQFYHYHLGSWRFVGVLQTYARNIVLSEDGLYVAVGTDVTTYQTNTLEIFRVMGSADHDVTTLLAMMVRFKSSKGQLPIDFVTVSKILEVSKDKISFTYHARGREFNSTCQVDYIKTPTGEWKRQLIEQPIQQPFTEQGNPTMNQPSSKTFSLAEFHDSIVARDLGSRCQFYKKMNGDWPMICEIETLPNTAERVVLISKDGKYIAIQSNIKPHVVLKSTKDQWIPRVDIFKLEEGPTYYQVSKLAELTLDKPRSLPDDFYQLYGNLTVEGEEISFVYERGLAFEDLVRHKVKCTFTQVSDTEWLFSSSQVYQPKQPEPIHQPKETTMDQATKDKIRLIFLNKGFTIKEGQPDLKPYVYEAAEALLREFQVKSHTPTTQEMFQEVDHLTPEENALLLDAQTKAQQHQKKVEYYASLASHLLNKPVE